MASIDPIITALRATHASCSSTIRASLPKPTHSLVSGPDDALDRCALLAAGDVEAALLAVLAGPRAAAPACPS